MADRLTEPCHAAIERRGRSFKIELPTGYRRDSLFAVLHDHHRFYEAPLLDFIEQNAPRGGVYVDVGANVGNHAIFFAAYGADRVVAFEPSAALASVCRRNLAENGLANHCEVHGWALGAVRGAKQLTAYGDAPERAPVLTLDDSLGARGPVRFIKVDTDGDDLAVLRGARRTLAAHRPHLCVEVSTPRLERAVPAFLDGFGYECDRAVRDAVGTPVLYFRPRECPLLVSVSVFNRPHLLRRMAESFRATDWPDVEREVHVWDDGSTHPDVPGLVKSLQPSEVHAGRVGMIRNYVRAADHAARRGARLHVMVDSDALLHPAWLDRLLSAYRTAGAGHEVAAVTAFTWDGYHELSSHGSYRRLQATGSVCALYDVAFWLTHDVSGRTLRAFDETAAYKAAGRAEAEYTSSPHFLAKAAQSAGAWIVGTRPSYAQHLGTEAHTSPSAPRAVAADFAGDA